MNNISEGQVDLIFKNMLGRIEARNLTMLQAIGLAIGAAFAAGAGAFIVKKVMAKYGITF